MTRYAEGTTVPADRSRAEIERTLERYGAVRFMYGSEPGRALIVFEMKGRRIRFLLPLPPVQEFRHTATGRARTSQASITEAYEQAVRQRWHALALIIKAKLEAIESGITTFEDEFLSRMMLPGGGTIGEVFAPELDVILASGEMPPLLGAAH